ncbi:MAG: Crp/Fnr family transcriptional regulator [Microthrixaceae bacterium]
MERSKLVEVTLFAALEDAELDRVLDASEDLELVRGDVLFKEGEPADTLFVVQSGRVAIGNRSVDGRESMVALMEAGDLFGEMSLFDGTGRSADARALEPSLVLSVPFTPLRAILDERPALLWEVVKMLSQRLRQMDAALADAFFLDVTGRTAKRLLELAGDADSFEIPITQEELAGLIGASRERVNKAISAFMRLGWIEQNERSYSILKRRELEIRAR